MGTAMAGPPLTVTWNICSYVFPTPSVVTRVTVLKPVCEDAGNHVIRPVVGLMLMPTGATVNEKRMTSLVLTFVSTR